MVHPVATCDNLVIILTLFWMCICLTFIWICINGRTYGHLISIWKQTCWCGRCWWMCVCVCVADGLRHVDFWPCRCNEGWETGVTLCFHHMNSPLTTQIWSERLINSFQLIIIPLTSVTLLNINSFPHYLNHLLWPINHWNLSMMDYYHLIIHKKTDILIHTNKLMANTQTQGVGAELCRTAAL